MYQRCSHTSYVQTTTRCPVEASRLQSSFKSQRM